MTDNEFNLRVEGYVEIAATMTGLRDENARLRDALTTIAGVLLQRHQEGWEERLYDIARAALNHQEATKEL